MLSAEALDCLLPGTIDIHPERACQRSEMPRFIRSPLATPLPRTPADVRALRRRQFKSKYSDEMIKHAKPTTCSPQRPRTARASPTRSFCTPPTCSYSCCT